MKKLISLGLLSTLSLIGMDAPKQTLTLDEASQLFLKDKTTLKKVNDLKSVGGIAALYVLHKSGKPFSQCAFVTTLGTVISKGDADNFHRLMSHIEMKPVTAVEDDGLTHIFSCASIYIMHIHKSCHTRGKELAAEIPDGQNIRWVCEPMRIINGCSMPVIDETQQKKISQWAQDHALFGELKEEDLVSLDTFANLDGADIYPAGWISPQEKIARLNKPTIAHE